jgi:hypothetical protein
MVPKEEMDVTERTAYEAHYKTFKQKVQKMEHKKSAWYRLFFPGDADYTLKYNPYKNTHRDNVYNPATGYYTTVGQKHYNDHIREN